VVTATGLQLQGLGGITITVDGEKVRPHDRFVYKGYMLDHVPNLAWCIGYTNASWTLRADMNAEAIAKLSACMQSHGYTHVYPHLRDKELPRGRPGTCSPTTSCVHWRCCRSRAFTGRGTLWSTMMRQPGAPGPGILGPCVDNVTASTSVSTVTLWLHGNVALYARSDPDAGPQRIMGIGLIADDPNTSKVTVVGVGGWCGEKTGEHDERHRRDARSRETVHVGHVVP
jgi:hypothetical protein